MVKSILDSIGIFSEVDKDLFEKSITVTRLNKNDLLLKEGEICNTAFYIMEGSCYQFQTAETEDLIIDLHLAGEWMFNHTSLINQVPSTTSIKVFEACEVVELSLVRLHRLIAQSQAFLQLGNIFNQSNERTYMFDNALSPAKKYHYINQVKPLISKVFPVKMIAAYLKMAPETLSRVRASW